MDSFKDWGKNETARLKAAALRELDPKNPHKNRLVSAWGLLIAGGLLIISLGVLYKMLHPTGE